MDTIVDDGIPTLTINSLSNLTIGSLAMYSLLFILCIYAYCSRRSENINGTLHFTLLTSIFGLLSSALQIGIPSSADKYSSVFKMLITSLFFGSTLVPLTWMVGISLFPILLKNGKPSFQVILGYLLTLIQFGLAITLAVYLGQLVLLEFEYPFINELKIINGLLISNVCLNWGFFLLLLCLMIQCGSSIPRSIMVTLSIFGVLNTARLITETALLRPGAQLEVETLNYIIFFFTDFMTCISLYLTTISWKNVEKISNNQQLEK